jgi:hypothetical protein
VMARGKDKGVRNRKVATYWRKHAVDESALDAVDTEGKAYVLGFIAADGYVSGNGLGFTIHERDIDVLEIVKTVLGSTHPIRPVKRNRVVLDISSKVLARRLVSLGLTPNKTRTVTPPTEIVDNLLPHWLRGYWDGDGWLTTGKRASGTVPVVGLAGWSQSLMAFTRDLCIAYSGKNVSLGKCHDGWSIRMVGQKARTWLDAVYFTATIGMERKARRAREIYALPELSLSSAQKARREREYDDLYRQRNEEMRHLKSCGWRNKDIAARYGLSQPITSMICNGRRG